MARASNIRDEFNKNQNLEMALKEINNWLIPLEAGLVSRFKKTKYPVVLILGCPRSGTTLFLQWLAGTGHFGYPSNLISRFYAAPYIGAKIQQMLTQYDFRNEIYDFNTGVPFQSDLGKTRGALAPHEFWYFWRRFFRFGEISILGPKDLQKVDGDMFVSELSALESVFNKPLVMKAMIMNWNIPFLDRLFDRVLFLFVKRHPFYNIQSLLESRHKYYGNFRDWYSFKPPEYRTLRNLDPYSQVAGQVFVTNQAIEKGLQDVDPGRFLVVDYEAFCRSPRNVFLKIAEKIRRQGYQKRLKYSGISFFSETNRVRLSPEEAEKVIKAYMKFSGQKISPDEDQRE